MRANSSDTPAVLELTALDILQKLYPGRVKLTTAETGAACALTAGSVRTMRTRGTFPVPCCADGKSYDIRDVAAYLDAQRHPQKAPQGRPTKAESAEAARRGITIKELRAQTNLKLDRGAQ